MRTMEIIALIIGYAFMVFGGFYFVMMFVVFFVDKVIIGTKNTLDCARWILHKRRNPLPTTGEGEG